MRFSDVEKYDWLMVALLRWSSMSTTMGRDARDNKKTQKYQYQSSPARRTHSDSKILETAKNTTVKVRPKK